MRFRLWLARAILAVSVLFLAPGCGMVTKMAANALAKPGDTLTSHDSPEFVSRAIPFGLVTFESLLTSVPKHRPLLLATCSGYTGYAYAFVETEAEIIGEEQHDKAQALRDEALKLYVRARDYCLRALDTRFEGISKRLSMKPDSAFDKIKLKKDDVELLYWTAASWGAAISLGLDRVDLVGDFPAVRVLADKAMSVWPDWKKGSLYELMMTLDSLPEPMGGAPAAKRDAVLLAHFNKAIELQKGLSPGPYVSMAAHIDISTKDPSEYPKYREEYMKLLNQALAIDPNKDPGNRLLTIITQRRAKAMIAQIDTKIPKIETKER